MNIIKKYTVDEIENTIEKMKIDCDGEINPYVFRLPLTNHEKKVKDFEKGLDSLIDIDRMSTWEKKMSTWEKEKTELQKHISLLWQKNLLNFRKKQKPKELWDLGLDEVEAMLSVYKLWDVIYN